MASIQEAIKRLSWIFTSSGADKVAADHNKVADANDALAVKSQKTEKSALDLDKAFAGLERRFDTTIRAQQDYQKVQDKVNEAVAQNPKLQERANNVLALASEHFDKANKSAGSFNQVLDAGRGALLGYSAGIGPIGALLGSFGPWGIAAAAGIGLVVNAFNYLSEAAAKAGDEASALKRFSDVSGLTTVQVRGVTEAGQELGVGADAISGALQKFTVNLDEARKGSGSLFDQLQRLDAKLADDIASSRSSGDALDLLTKAFNRTTDATMKAALAKAAFGKGGQAVGPVLGVLAEGGGLDEYSKQAAKDLGVTKEWTEEVARLRNANKDMADDLKTIESTFFAKELLQRQGEFLKQQLAIAIAIRDTKSAYDESTDEFDVQRNTASQSFIKPAVSDDVLGNKFANALSLENTAAIEAEKKATEELAASRLEAANAERTAATDSAGTVALLGEAATGAEIAAANFHKLTAAFLENKFGAQDSAEAMEKYQRALNGGTANAVAALQDQRAVIEAIGGAAKMAAQYWADYNAEMRKVGDETKAAAIASEKLANAQASANASAKESIKSMKDQNELAKARTDEEEQSIAARQKYNEVLENTKDPLLAEEAKLQVIEKYNIQIEIAARKRVSAYDAAAAAAQREADAVAAAAAAAASAAATAAYNAANGNFGQAGGYSSGDSTVKAGTQYTSTSNLGEFILLANTLSQSTSDIISSSLTGGVDAAIAKLKTTKISANPLGLLGSYEQYGLPSKGTQGDITSGIMSLYDLKNTQAGNDNAARMANYQDELAFLQQQPKTIANLSAIANLNSQMQSLANSTDSLANSTDSLNSTMQDALSPYYTQDPRTSHIGFRSQGMATGGEFTVPGGYSANDNMTAIVPVASGEIVSVRRLSGQTGTSGGTQNITINAPMAFHGNVNKDEVGRTVFQTLQGAGKQIRQAAQ